MFFIKINNEYLIIMIDNIIKSLHIKYDHNTIYKHVLNIKFKQQFKINSTQPWNFGEVFEKIVKLINENVPYLLPNQINDLLVGAPYKKQAGWIGKNLCDKLHYNADVFCEHKKHKLFMKILFQFIQNNIIPKILKCIYKLEIENERLKNIKRPSYYLANICKELGLKYIDMKDWITWNLLMTFREKGYIQYPFKYINLKTDKEYNNSYVKVLKHDYIPQPYICPIDKKSIPHKLMREWLKNKLDKTKYFIKEEYKFYNGIYNDTNRKFSYDFCVINKISGIILLLIEVDGEQHFKYVELFKNNKQEKNDKIKNQYIINNKYKLLRIHHKDVGKDKLVRCKIDEVMNTKDGSIIYSCNEKYKDMIEYLNK